MRAVPLLLTMLAACVGGRDEPGDDSEPPSDSEPATDSEPVVTETDPGETDVGETDAGETDRPPASPWGDQTPTFAQIRADVITKRCVNSCHINSEGELYLDGSRDDWSRLVNAPAAGKEGEILVVPGEPFQSYLVKKLMGEGGVEGGPMPVDAPLPEWAVDGIVDWIRAGALDDGTSTR